MAAEYTERLGLRMRPGLRQLLEDAGDPSAAARALMLIGLSTLGADLGPFRADLLDVLSAVTDPAVHTAILGLLNGGSTTVQPSFNSDHSAFGVFSESFGSANGPAAPNEQGFEI